MVNINSVAEVAVAAYSAAIALGGNYSVPLHDVASQVSSFFLPNYSSFSLGQINVSPNQSIVAENFVKEYNEFRAKSGLETDIWVGHSRVEVVSDESALWWITYHICPTNGMQGWGWTNVYGFRMLKGGTETGLEGGWEFAIGDNEHSQYAKRFPKANGRCSICNKTGSAGGFHTGFGYHPSQGIGFIPFLWRIIQSSIMKRLSNLRVLQHSPYVIVLNS